ncbi:hypothetical protein [Micromonospora arida]
MLNVDSAIQQRSLTTEGPSRYVIENGFRSTRLTLKDLEKINQHAGNSQRWLCSTLSTLPAADHVRRRLLTEWSARTLEELINKAPDGRIFHFELVTEIEGAEVRVSMGDRWAKNLRSIAAASYSKEVALPAAYHEIVNVLHTSAKRGRAWHYLSSTLMALCILLAAQVWRFVFEVLRAESQDGGNSIALSAATASILVILGSLLFLPLWLAGFRQLTASSIRIKPHIATRRATSIARSTWAWLKFAYSKDRGLEYKTYLATNAGWIFGMIGTVIAILAWLFPRK